MVNEVFDDRRVCDNCEKVFLLSDETTENIEGKCNPEIHEETYEGIYCWKCINSIEEKEKYSLTTNQWMELTDDLVELVKKYSKKEEHEWSNIEDEPETWGKFCNIRETIHDFIEEVRGKNNG